MHRLERIIEGAISGYVNFRGLSTPWTLKTWRRDWSLRRIAHKTIATFVAKFAGAFMCSGPWAVRRSGWHASRSKAGHLEERVARSSQPRCVGVTRAPRRRTVASWEKGGGSNVFFFKIACNYNRFSVFKLGASSMRKNPNGAGNLRMVLWMQNLLWMGFI